MSEGDVDAAVMAVMELVPVFAVVLLALRIRKRGASRAGRWR